MLTRAAFALANSKTEQPFTKLLVIIIFMHLALGNNVLKLVLQSVLYAGMMFAKSVFFYLFYLFIFLNLYFLGISQLFTKFFFFYSISTVVRGCVRASCDSSNCAGRIRTLPFHTNKKLATVVALPIFGFTLASEPPPSQLARRKIH